MHLQDILSDDFQWPSQEVFVAQEFLQVGLIETLEQGKKYCLEFYVSLHSFDTINKATGTNCIQAAFSNDSASCDLNFNQTLLSPIVMNDRSIVIDDTLNWTQVYGEFIATGTEKFLVIGCFDPIELIIPQPIAQIPTTNYYFLDDVFLYYCPDSTDNLEIKIPNIFSPDNDGVNEHFTIEYLPVNSSLLIYNRWGQSVLDKKNYTNDWDAHEVSSGVYYYILTLPNNERRTGFVEVIK